MNKTLETKRLFWKIANSITDCCDAVIKNDKGEVLERGIMLFNDCSGVTFGNDGVIRVYNEHEEIDSFTEESEELLILKELFEVLQKCV